jgi:hypothetical protein
MSRAMTLAGYAVLACALVLHEITARRARQAGQSQRALTFGELLDALMRRGIVRWPLLAAWLWLGWHLFARVHWE